jgi:Zn finger protein HypA/HybF involved in hydrogenase expression
MPDIGLVYYSIGGIPLLALRIFPTTFCLALFARFQPGLFDAFPSWLRSDLALWVLGLLALAEIVAYKNPEFSDFFNAFDREIKAAAYLIYSGIVIHSGELTVAAPDSSLLKNAMLGGSLAWSTAAAAGTWALAGSRQAIWDVLIEIDDDDSLGIRRLISWMEDFWVAIGVGLLVLLPMLSLLASGLTVLGLIFFQKAIRKRELQALIPCKKCGANIHPSALSCPACHSDINNPLTMNFWGLPSDLPVSDTESHRLNLISKRRCLVCASKLPNRSIQQKCPMCGALVIPSEAWFDAYLRFVQRGLGRTLVVCFCFGLVPVIGLVPGIIYYRFGLISNLRRYIPRTVGCLTRWVVRIINLVLLGLQGIPLVGAVALPAMCLTNYFVYRTVLCHERGKAFGAQRTRGTDALFSTSTV